MIQLTQINTPRENMKQILIRLLTSIMVLSMYSQAFAMPQKPATCPHAALIKSFGLAYTDFEEGTYSVFQINNYGTRNLWGFGIGDINASSPQEALSIGYIALASLSGTPLPIAIPSDNIWACFYSNNSGLISVAFTPIPVAAHFNQTMKLHLK